MKRKEKIEFNPADYDYMDDMPLEGWIWEFIRRSKNYQEKYETIRKNIKKGAYKNHDEELNEELNKIGFRYIGHSEEINSDYFLILRSTYDRYGKSTYCIPKPQSKYIDIYKNNFLLGLIKGIRPYQLLSFENVFPQIENRLPNPYKHMINTLTVSKPEDMIFVGISKKAKIKDIEKYLLLYVVKRFWTTELITQAIVS